MHSVTLIQPDDFHVHLRDSDALKLTVPQAAAQFNRITVMPNLQPAVDDTETALAYLDRINQHIPSTARLTPLMALYLTPKLTHEELVKAKQAGIDSVKLYPQGATTNSEQGVADIKRFEDTFAHMAELGIRLLIHGEVSDAGVDIFERESQFYTLSLPSIVKRHPTLTIVAEHITTQKAIEFVAATADNIAATITPQHLLANRNHLLSGGIKPHYYCLPILKKESDRLALLKVATSGSPKFFLGTDSAPHATGTKENACGCAGCYSMPYAIEYYAEAFDSVGKIDKLSDFAGRFGAEFYGLPLNDSRIELVKRPQTIADNFAYLDETITPFLSGHVLSWSKAS
ncbi:MAG: dihydroorotase [Gammaproteobacteria bacterium]|nr:MAG: dihydroorotase [Gammaproteobacteria bacterium]